MYNTDIWNQYSQIKLNETGKQYRKNLYISYDSGIPLCAICSNGHGFCLSCSLQLHSPCTCPQMQKWLQQVVFYFTFPVVLNYQNKNHCDALFNRFKRKRNLWIGKASSLHMYSFILQTQYFCAQIDCAPWCVISDVSGDDIANALWVAANTKRCPRCNTPIEKDEGCNHMRWAIQEHDVVLAWLLFIEVSKF